MAQPEELQRALTTLRTAAMAANPGNKAHVDMVMAAAGEMCKGATMSSTQVRKSGGGVQYRLEMLLEGLLLARLLKDASDLPAAMVPSINFLLGPSTVEVCRKAIVVLATVTQPRDQFQFQTLYQRGDADKKMQKPCDCECGKAKLITWKQVTSPSMSRCT